MNNRSVCPNASLRAGSEPGESTHTHEAVDAAGKEDTTRKAHKCLKSNCANWRENKCKVFTRLLDGIEHVQPSSDRQHQTSQDSFTSV